MEDRPSHKKMQDTPPAPAEAHSTALTRVSQLWTDELSQETWPAQSHQQGASHLDPRPVSAMRSQVT